MKKANKLLPILVTTILLFTPYYVKAEEEQTNQPGTEIPSESPSTTPDPVESPEPSPTPETKSIILNETSITLDSGKTTKLTATVTPSDATVVWSSSDEKVAKVDKNGNITAVGEGKAKITAKIEDTDISAECKITVNAIETKSSDATLKKLTITNGTLNKTFKSDVLEYSVTIDKDISSLKIEYELSDSNAGYLATGNSNLKNGSVVKLLITAEDGTQKTYQLTIVKDEVSLNLKSLEINGYALNEVFQPEKTEYTASIPYEIETITVKASPENSNATAKATGLTNLKVGTNTVTVTVSDNDGNSKIYKIIVTREKEVSVEENPTSIITSSNKENNNSSTSTAISKNNNNDDSFLKYAIVSLACFILFAIGGIVIYFYLKTSPKK